MSERSDTERLDWLLNKMQKEPYLYAIHNPYTGYFINTERWQGYCNGEERWDRERLAEAPKDASFRQAIDAAMDAEEKEK